MGPLPYRQSTSATSTLAGDIRYTTYKSTFGGHVWLTMLHSQTSSIERFKIDGGSGVYNNAHYNGGISRGSLGASTVDSRYSGWYFKVATRYKPSINHLIIALDSSWTHSSYTRYFDYRHTLTKVRHILIEYSRACFIRLDTCRSLASTLSLHLVSEVGIASLILTTIDSFDGQILLMFCQC